MGLRCSGDASHIDPPKKREKFIKFLIFSSK